MKLDSKAPARVKPPAGKADHIEWDDELSGFGLRVRNGRKTWVVQYRGHGRTRRMKLGAAEKLSAEQARKAAKAALAKVELGGDPQAEKAEKRRKANALTLAQMAADFLTVQEKRLRPPSFYMIRLYLTEPGYFGPLLSVVAADVSLADVAARLRKITNERGSVTAARARSALSSCYVWGMKEGLLGPAPVNPVAGTNRPTDATPRDRVLDDAELAQVWHACGENDLGRAIRLLILTGCRKSEIGRLHWSEIDFNKRTITLSKERTKNKRTHMVALADITIEIIRSVPRRLGRDYVFGAQGQGFTGWAEGKVALDAKLDGMVKWMIHDLRRSAATGMANIGVMPHVIEAALNHQSGHKGGIAGVYNRSVYAEETKAAFLRWADHIAEIVAGAAHRPPAHKVIPLVALEPQ
jgi:integrase